MKALILAGGFGSRISEESGVRPKPMVEIGGKPILWHIMKIFSHYGINDFVICLGYKGSYIKEYFANYYQNCSDLYFDFENHETKILTNHIEPWRITLVDTGQKTMTGGRLKKAQKYLGNETFCMTYGDGVSDLNISELVAFHKKNQNIATVTAVKEPGRFGSFTLNKGEHLVQNFREKVVGLHSAWINGGFFVLEPEVFDYIDNDLTVFEHEPMEKLSSENKLDAFRHDGFWMSMDTLRDKKVLEQYWNENPLWKVW